MKPFNTTAYPSLKQHHTAQELDAQFAPSCDELALLQNLRKPELKLGFMLHLKLIQRLGYVLSLQEVPKQLIRYVNRQLPATPSIKHDQLLRYDSSASRQRHLQQIRRYLGLKPFTLEDEPWLTQIARKAATTKEVLEDIINVMLEG